MALFVNQLAWYYHFSDVTNYDTAEYALCFCLAVVWMVSLSRASVLVLAYLTLERSWIEAFHFLICFPFFNFLLLRFQSF